MCQLWKDHRRPLPEDAQGADETSWEIPLLSLQWIMKYAVHLAGESALDMAGYAHYLSLGGRPRVQFHGEVPSWLKRLPVQTEIVVRQRTLFGDDPVGIDDAGLEAGSSGASVDVWRWPIKASSPERAILEALDELPHRASFENLDKNFEGLVSLRPKQLVALLTACRSASEPRVLPMRLRHALHEPRLARLTSDAEGARARVFRARRRDASPGVVMGVVTEVADMRVPDSIDPSRLQRYAQSTRGH